MWLFPIYGYPGASHRVAYLHLSLPQAIVTAEVIYNAAIISVKSSILCLYHRLFPQRWFKNTVWIVGAFVIAYSINLLLCLILQCKPVALLWDKRLKGKCIDMNAVFVTTGVINVITDITILCLPMPLLWRLLISTTQKVQLIGVFLLGGL